MVARSGTETGGAGGIGRHGCFGSKKPVWPTGADLFPEGHSFTAGERPALLATIHPSYLLRIRSPDDRARERLRFVSDLSRGWEMAASNISE